MTQKKPARNVGRHSALGRGLGALIPSQISEASSQEDMQADPLDVFFPARSNAPARQRGGSAKDLLIPKGSSSVSDGTSRGASKKSESKNRATSRVSSRAAASRPAASDLKRSPGFEDAQESTIGAPRVEDSRSALPAGGSSAGSSASSSKKGSRKKTETPVEGVASEGSQEKKFSDAGGEQGDAPLQKAAKSKTADVSRETSDELLPVPGASFAEVPLAYIVPNTRQPREVFDEDDLTELRDSIREVGVLQPVVVRPIDFDAPLSGRMEASLREKPEARFELIMGERRLRASELAGSDTIPAIIRQTEDEDLLRDALLENLHRAQLNPLEEASAYQQLMADFGATQEELSKRIARSRPQIANTLRLLKLPPSVQRKVAAQVISAGHARALLSLDSVADMELLAERIVAEGLSVRTTEELVRLGRAKAAPRPRSRRRKDISALGERVVSALQDAYETRVTITEGAKKGRIIIEFAGTEDLERIAELIISKR